jgi:hypothetical protein
MQRLQAIIGNGLLYRWDNVWVFNKQEIEEMKELDLMELTKRIESKTKTRL